MTKPQPKVVVVGAGPVGLLAALYAARRNLDVEIYELRNCLQNDYTAAHSLNKSINLALSERGIMAIRHADVASLLDEVMSTTVPMKGRLIHRRRANGELYQEAQAYDPYGRTIFALDRAALNRRLLNALEMMPNVRIFYGHKLIGLDYAENIASFETTFGQGEGGREKRVQVKFGFLVGADGAHSAVRTCMQKFVCMNYQQEYIDTLWCEFTLPGKENSCGAFDYQLSPNYLHIWPARESMFIAIPSMEGKFTCTLFASNEFFRFLEADPARIPAILDCHFPGVVSLISPPNLIAQFNLNPHLPLISVKCSPHHVGSSVVLLGDAAHAMVPFYGQGMNAGLEDVRILFEILDRHGAMTNVGEQGATPETTLQCSRALLEYSDIRVPDAHAINDLAFQNYSEMRDAVLSPSYRLQKWLEEAVSVHLPCLGWRTKYMRVTFSIERYSEVVKKGNRQVKLIIQALAIGLTVPLAVSAMTLYWRLRRTAVH